MRILVAMECSGRFREALRRRGHDAWSCDLQPAEDGSPFHIQGNVFDHDIVHAGWGGMIAHPDCTFVAVSGARWQSIEWRREAMQMAVYTARALWAFPIEYVALENPISRLSTLWMKPTQVVQPHWFGDPAFKATCWWLRKLRKLVPTNQLEVPEKGTDEWKKWSAVHYESPGKDRKKNRARAFPGMCEAAAEQWFQEAALAVAI